MNPKNTTGVKRRILLNNNRSDFFAIPSELFWNTAKESANENQQTKIVASGDESITINC